VVIISTQNKVVNKGHVGVYRTLVDELLQFHQLKRNFNHFDKFYLKARKFPRFSMHECNAHFGFLFIYSLTPWDVTLPRSSPSSYVFVHHAFVANVIVFIPNYIIYSNNHGLHRHFSLFTALCLATDTEASSASPSDIDARLIMVPSLRCPVCAIPDRAFIPNAFPSLASSRQHLVFIGFDNAFFGTDYFPTSASTASLTSSLSTQFWQIGVYAFIPDVRLVLAKLGAAPRPRRLRLHRLWHRHPSSMTTSMCLRHSSQALSSCGFLCGYLDISTPPRHPLARLPRPRLQHSALSATSTSAQGLSPRMSHPRLPLQSKHLRHNNVHDAPAPTAGGCQPVGFYVFIFSPV
jgi:hypothetical protein